MRWGESCFQPSISVLECLPISSCHNLLTLICGLQSCMRYIVGFKSILVTLVLYHFHFNPIYVIIISNAINRPRKVPYFTLVAKLFCLTIDLHSDVRVLCTAIEYYLEWTLCYWSLCSAGAVLLSLCYRGGILPVYRCYRMLYCTPSSIFTCFLMYQLLNRSLEAHSSFSSPLNLSRPELVLSMLSDR